MSIKGQISRKCEEGRMGKVSLPDVVKGFNRMKLSSRYVPPRAVLTNFQLPVLAEFRVFYGSRKERGRKK